jgi:hypothetical protein
MAELGLNCCNNPWPILHVFFCLKCFFSWLECGWDVREMALVDLLLLPAVEMSFPADGAG